jgi:hypothetical protein
MCKLGAALGVLPQLDRALLSGWLDTGLDANGRAVSATTMARALTAEGYDVGATTVKDHRGRRCSCYREG